MDPDRRRQLASTALDGYRSGPDAPIEATVAALSLADTARSVILVEGISDQIALEAVASRRGRYLRAEGIVIVPVGGASAFARYIDRFGPNGSDLTVAGLCDAGEEGWVRRGLVDGGIGSPQSRAEMERLGFFVCVDDLEDELIRASGRPAIETALESQGDLGSFQTLQRQPAWRDEEFSAQVHRWLGAGARRKLRYARLLAGSLPIGRVPQPLEAVLALS